MLRSPSPLGRGGFGVGALSDLADVEFPSPGASPDGVRTGDVGVSLSNGDSGASLGSLPRAGSPAPDLATIPEEDSRGAPSEDSRGASSSSSSLGLFVALASAPSSRSASPPAPPRYVLEQELFGARRAAMESDEAAREAREACEQSRRDAESAVSRSKAAESIAASALAHAEAAEAKHLEETSNVGRAVRRARGGSRRRARRGGERRQTRGGTRGETRTRRRRRVGRRVARFVVPETFAASRLFVPVRARRRGEHRRGDGDARRDRRDRRDRRNRRRLFGSGRPRVDRRRARGGPAPRDARGSRVRIGRDGRLVAVGCARRREGGGERVAIGGGVARVETRRDDGRVGTRDARRE